MCRYRSQQRDLFSGRCVLTNSETFVWEGEAEEEEEEEEAEAAEPDAKPDGGESSEEEAEERALYILCSIWEG